MIAACLALGAAMAGVALWHWTRNPERWWARGEWSKLASIRGDGPVAIHWRSVGLLGLGRPEEAVAEVRKLQLARCAPVLFLNSLVEALVTAGRYREAIEATARVPFRGDGWEPHERVLVLINAAEALYNQGRWESAHALLETLDGAAKRDALTRSALALQRSWICAGLGRAKEADVAVRQVVREDLPRSYWPEVHFARGFCALTAGNVSGASEEVSLAEALALRASSKRNVHFFRARIRVAQGDWVSAERELAAGAAHAFQYQGGDGLLLWGDVLQKLGRPEEAQAAWELARLRDPQSDAAVRALQRSATAQSAG